MIIPIRCFSCGKPVAHLWDSFQNETEKGKSPKEVLDKLNVTRYCCRALFLGHIPLINITSKFKKD